MSFAAIKLLIAKAPGWVWFIPLTLIVAGLLYAAGARNEARKAHDKALADSVKVSRAHVEAVKKTADTAEIVANIAEKKGVPLRHRATAAVHDTTNHVPESVIALVDSAFAQDSTTIARKDTVIAAKNEEIVARIELDTLSQHQIVFKPPARGLTGVAVTTVKVAVVVYVGVQVARWLLHR